MRHKLFRTLGACLLGLVLLLLFGNASLARAETFLKSPYYVSDVTWIKAGNPYYLTGDLVLEKGATLTIEKGVEIIGTTTTFTFQPFMSLGGNVKMLGTKDEPVRIKNLGLSLLRGSDNTIENVIFDNAPIHVTKNRFDPPSTTTIKSSLFVNSPTALKISSGSIVIEETEFKENNVGIRSDSTAINPNIIIRNSYFGTNKVHNIENAFPTPMEATLNWWGSAEGPGSSVTGAVNASPWKMFDPRLPKIECCSNVLFLPGLEASRLYREDKDPLGPGTSTHRSWEPYTNADVRSLFLNPDGTTINQTVHTKDVIDAGLGLVPIYKSFVAMMNGLVADKTINEWLPYAYDWRFSPEEIVNTTKYSDSTKKLVEEVERLASVSKTGKVTIIAHSYGGLIAKMLGQILEKEGKAALIDKVVFVGVPQLGTPQAVASMLHGTGQGILGGIILKSGVARALGLTMAGAYSLLPSAEYLNRILDPVLTLAQNAVGSLSGFSDFVTGKSDGRIQPKESDTKTPAVLESTLLAKSQNLHEKIDTWQFPTPTEVISIVGWGEPTTRRIEYETSSPRLYRDPDGDGTVVMESAGGYSPVGAGNMYFNIGLFNKDTGEHIAHPNILEADPLKKFLLSIISTSTISSVKNTSEYITTTKPQASDYTWMKWLKVSVHSPVELDITDERGGHMGNVPLSQKVPEAKDSDLTFYENTIGGQYEEIGDEKYVTLPADGVYNVGLKGTGAGTFTFQIQKLVGGDMTEVANVVYADLPVTPLLMASTTISSTMLSPELSLDVDGNGTTDLQAPPSPTLNPALHLTAMKTIILSLGFEPKLEKKLVQKIEKIEKSIAMGDAEKMVTILKNTEEKLVGLHWKKVELSDAEKESLAALFEGVLDALVK